MVGVGVTILEELVGANENAEKKVGKKKLDKHNYMMSIYIFWVKAIFYTIIPQKDIHNKQFVSLYIAAQKVSFKMVMIQKLLLLYCARGGGIL